MSRTWKLILLVVIAVFAAAATAGVAVVLRQVRGVVPLLVPSPGLEPRSTGADDADGRTVATGQPEGGPPTSTAGTVAPEASEAAGTLPLRSAAGLKARIFARGLEGPRVLAFDPGGALLVSQTRAGSVVALADDDKDGVAEKKALVVRGLRQPHGLAFRPRVSPPQLYIAENHRVRRYAYEPSTNRASRPAFVIGLPSGGGHHTRTIAFGPDGRLFIAAGSTGNVGVERDRRRAAMTVCDPDGKDARLFAKGLRNTVFFIFDGEGRIWGNDMGRDLLGDDIPPDELNIIRDGEDYGWPYCYGARVPDPFGGTPAICADTEAPVFGYQAHSAPLGLAFIPTRAVEAGWPEAWLGDLVVAFHGSWNRTVPTGYKLVRLDVRGASVARQHDLVTGWLTIGRVSGRPVAVVFGSDGGLYVSDDRAGYVYRITAR